MRVMVECKCHHQAVGEPDAVVREIQEHAARCHGRRLGADVIMAKATPVEAPSNPGLQVAAWLFETAAEHARNPITGKVARFVGQRLRAAQPDAASVRQATERNSRRPPRAMGTAPTRAEAERPASSPTTRSQDGGAAPDLLTPQRREDLRSQEALQNRGLAKRRTQQEEIQANQVSLGAINAQHQANMGVGPHS